MLRLIISVILTIMVSVLSEAKNNTFLSSFDVDFDNPITPKRSDRLEHIRYLINKYPPIQLPFQYKSQTSLRVTEFEATYGIDSLVFGEDAPCGIIGVIVDTSVFFGFFYLRAADDATPSFIAYSKSGELIEKKSLTESCWQGCESDCNSWVTIDVDLHVEFRFEYFEYDYEPDYSYCAEVPNLARGHIAHSHINSTGKIIEDDLIPISSEELMRNPIIHDNN